MIILLMEIADYIQFIGNNYNLPSPPGRRAGDEGGAAHLPKFHLFPDGTIIDNQ
jgi:hypothetical protein